MASITMVDALIWFGILGCAITALAVIIGQGD